MLKKLFLAIKLTLLSSFEKVGYIYLLILKLNLQK